MKTNSGIKNIDDYNLGYLEPRDITVNTRSLGKTTFKTCCKLMLNTYRIVLLRNIGKNKKKRTKKWHTS